ncbi:MAG: hypothetical protein RL385_1022 [Pseudomonadota bacterium]
MHRDADFVSTIGPESRGSLLLVGTGIEGQSHITAAARRALELASKVLFAVADAETADFIRALRPDAESLSYGAGDTPRAETDRAMVDRILSEVRAGHRVCAAFYGHPALLTRPSLLALQEARAAGFVARMLPAVSALDCLCADLGFDPGESGLQVYEATVFLRRQPSIDPRTPLILLQPAMLGNRAHHGQEAPGAIADAAQGLRVLLTRSYPPGKRGLVYLASTECARPHMLESLALSELDVTRLPELATLFIPPSAAADALGRNAETRVRQDRVGGAP